MLLHLIAQIDRDMPVIFLNTQKIFGETLAYRDELAEKLGFTDLRVYPPRPAPARGQGHDRPALVLRPRRLLRPAQGRAAAPRAGAVRCVDFGPQGLPGQRRATAMPRFEDGRGPAEAQPARRLGQAAISTPISTRTICPGTRSRRRAIPRSAARPAPARSCPAKTPRRPLARLGQGRMRHPCARKAGRGTGVLNGIWVRNLTVGDGRTIFK